MMLIGRIGVVIERIHSVQQFAVLLLSLLIGVAGRSGTDRDVGVCSVGALGWRLQGRLRIRLLLLWRSLAVVVRLLVHERRAFTGGEQQRVIVGAGTVELVVVVAAIQAFEHVAWTAERLIHVQVEAVRRKDEWVRLVHGRVVGRHLKSHWIWRDRAGRWDGSDCAIHVVLVVVRWMVVMIVMLLQLLSLLDVIRELSWRHPAKKNWESRSCQSIHILSLA